MSVGIKAGTGVVSDGDETGGSSGRDPAGVVFARLSVVPALLAVAWLLAGMAFLAVGWFRPLPVTALAVVLAVPLVWFGVRAVPGLPGRAAASLPGEDRRTPWWPLVAVGVIALAFCGQQAARHGQFVIITRDPGAYFQFGTWLARHGSVPIPADAPVFGGTHGGSLTFASYAVYAHGAGALLPQFMAGLPMVLAGAMWAGGYEAALLMAPVLGTLAVVTFAGLAARLIGARWAPLAALAVAVSLPMQYTSRATYSEPLAEILLLGGLAMVLDGLRDGRAARGARTAAGLGGLALGLTVLARIDGLSDILPVIPFCGAMIVRRRPQAAWLTAGLAAGTAIGAAEGATFGWPYLVENRASVEPLTALLIVVTAATAAGTWAFRRRRLPRWWGWLANAAPAAAFGVMLFFGVRPYFQRVRGVSNAHKLIRTYAELSLHWVDWYMGLPVIFLATAGAALLARRCLRGRAGDWALPLTGLAWAVLLFLYRPGINPDQPWAGRRLVPEVIPAFVLLGVWAIAYGAAWLKARHALAAACALAVVGAAAVVGPAAVANWGLGVSHANGLHLTADGLAGKRDHQGELYFMENLCRSLPAKAAVVFIGPNESPMIMQDIRGMCGVPVAQVSAINGYGRRSMSDQAAAGIAAAAAASAQRAGRVPVVLAMYENLLQPLQGKGAIRHVDRLDSTIDPGVLHGVPKDPRYQLWDAWMWRPSAQRS